MSTRPIPSKLGRSLLRSRSDQPTGAPRPPAGRRAFDAPLRSSSPGRRATRTHARTFPLARPDRPVTHEVGGPVMIFNVTYAHFCTNKHDSAPFKVSNAHALHPRAHHLNINTPAGPRWWHTPRSHRGPSSTRAQRETSARRRRSSHRHHHKRRATPVATICAARPDSTRAKRSSMSKIHAPPRNLAS